MQTDLTVYLCMNIILKNNTLYGRLAEATPSMDTHKPARDAKCLIYSTLPPPQLGTLHIDSQSITRNNPFQKRGGVPKLIYTLFPIPPPPLEKLEEAIKNKVIIKKY